MSLSFFSVFEKQSKPGTITAALMCSSLFNEAKSISTLMVETLFLSVFIPCGK